MPATDTPPTAGTLGAALYPYLKGAPALYVTGEDQLRLRSFNSAAGVTLALEGRVLGLDGCISPISAPHLPNTDRSAVTSLHAIGEGWLQHLSVRATVGAPRRGQCFIVAELVRGQTGAVQPLGVVLQGYVKDSSGLAWPGSPIEDSASGRGVIRAIVGTDPAAGAEILETVPANARWQLIAFNYTLVASAAAANRRPVLTIDDGANIVWQTFNNINQTANQTAIYRAGIGLPIATYDALAYHLPLPEQLPLMGGFRIRTVTAAIDVGDNYAAPILLVEEWIED